MSIRMVTTALEVKSRQAGGKRIQQALADAKDNLQALAPETLRLIDAGLQEITLLCSETGEARPTGANLQRIVMLSDELIGYCGAVCLPGLDEAFIRLCQLAHAVLNSDYWKPDTFGPALMVLRLTRHQSPTPEELARLFEGIDQCTAMYLSHTS